MFCSSNLSVEYAIYAHHTHGMHIDVLVLAICFYNDACDRQTKHRESCGTGVSGDLYVFSASADTWTYHNVCYDGFGAEGTEDEQPETDDILFGKCIYFLCTA